MLGGPLFHDRRDAGVRLAGALEAEVEAAPRPVAVGLARGGVEVAAEAARAFRIPLDALAVRKVGHPGSPSTPSERWRRAARSSCATRAGFPRRRCGAVAAAQRDADELDRRLHAAHPLLDLTGATCVLCDDGLATGATMIVAIRWARAHGASRVIAAVPVAAAETAAVVRREADGLVCLYELRDFWAVGVGTAASTRSPTRTSCACSTRRRVPRGRRHERGAEGQYGIGETGEGVGMRSGSAREPTPARGARDRRAASRRRGGGLRPPLRDRGALARGRGSGGALRGARGAGDRGARRLRPRGAGDALRERRSRR